MRAKQLRQWLLVFLLLLIIFWLLSLIVGLASKAKIAIEEMRRAQGEYHELEKRRDRLEANLSAIETALGRDAAIRDAFGVARLGEEIIVVVPPAEIKPEMAPTLWQTILGWFK